MHVCVHMYVHTCTRTWVLSVFLSHFTSTCTRTWVSVECLPQSLHLIFQRESLSASGSQWLARLVGQHALGILLSPPPQHEVCRHAHCTCPWWMLWIQTQVFMFAQWKHYQPSALHSHSWTSTIPTVYQDPGLCPLTWYGNMDKSQKSHDQ